MADDLQIQQYCTCKERKFEVVKLWKEACPVWNGDQRSRWDRFPAFILSHKSLDCLYKKSYFFCRLNDYIGVHTLEHFAWNYLDPVEIWGQWGFGRSESPFHFIEKKYIQIFQHSSYVCLGQGVEFWSNSLIKITPIKTAFVTCSGWVNKACPHLM